MGPAVARAWRADTGHVRNGARAVPTVRAEILARPPQPRPLLLRPLRRPRSPRQVCDDPRRSASGGQERPQMRGLRRADQGREVDEALLFGALPGRRASCWRLEPSPLCPCRGRWCVPGPGPYRGKASQRAPIPISPCHRAGAFWGIYILDSLGQGWHGV
jgi:hypothetical protein